MELPKTAIASVLTKIGEPLEMRELPICQPNPGEALVEVLRANICGSDVHMFTGGAFRGFGLPFPFILGHELVGRVAALGEGVDSDSDSEPLRIGDRVTFSYYRGCRSCLVCARGDEHACLQSLMSVMCPCQEPPHFTGGFAQYYVVRKGQAIYRLPDAVSDEVAAGANCALAQVIHGFDCVQLRAGERVVIQGAGGLGLYATAVAKKRGAAKVIVIDGVPARLALAKKLGADEVISIEEMTDPKQRTMAVKSATGGGADVVVEVVGKSDALREGVRMLDRTGRYLVMGSVVPKQPVKLDPSLWVGGNLSLHGVALYPKEALLAAVRFLAEATELPLGDMVASYPLQDVNEAMAAAQSREDVCRVQLTMEGA